MYFTLCIPTMDRYDTFLIAYLIKYVANPLINEIIITDENGNDIQKILESNIEKSKLKLYKNDNRLGPFLNKLRACNLATNEWIALIDSDNFADEEYFNISYKYIKQLINPKYDIISPSFAKPAFDYRHLHNNIITKTSLKSLIDFDDKNRGVNAGLSTLMNTGNYILNNSLITEINLNNEINNIPYSSACDVIYFNTLLFEQFDVKFHILSGLEYEHVVHHGSIYTTTCNKYPQFNNYVYHRFANLYQ
jgi:hypothetical protein